MNRPSIAQRLTKLKIPQEPGNARRQAHNSSRSVVLGYALFVGLLTLLHSLDFDVPFSAETALLVLMSSVVAASKCPRLSVVVIVLASGVIWCGVDLTRNHDWLIRIFGHAIRVVTTLLLVFLVSHVKKQLELARHLARIDDLTGLSNRPAILEALDVELCRVRRFGRSLSIAMLDCDDFKQINDMHGHRAGDRLLQRIAEALRKSSRAYDCVGRLGGDEFVIIISEVNASEVPVVIERMRVALRHELSGEANSPTFSIGVITIQFHDRSEGMPIDCLDYLQRADEVMYEAKRSGRDQTRFETIDFPESGSPNGIH